MPSKEEISYTFKVDNLDSYFTLYVTKALLYKIRFYQSTLKRVIKKEKFTKEVKNSIKNKARQFSEVLENGDIAIYETKYVTKKTTWSKPNLNNPHTILDMLE